MTTSQPPGAVDSGLGKRLRVEWDEALSLPRKRWIAHISAAVATVLIASALRILLEPVLYDRAAFLLFAVAVMISAWIGGWRMGLLATLLASFAGIWLFVRPYYETHVHDVQDAVQSVLFAVTGCGISLLAGQMHAERRFAEKQALAATKSRDELAGLLESLTEGFQAFDLDFRLTYMNGAAERLLDRSQADLMGRDMSEQFPAMIGEDVKALMHRAMTERRAGSIEVRYEPWGRWFAINVYPFRDGISVLFRDISDRMQAQAEREGLIAELQEALANVHTLQGLIPICAGCKRIRDDQGYWEQVDVYFRDHADVEFSHGLCPDCVKKYWGT